MHLPVAYFSGWLLFVFNTLKQYTLYYIEHGEREHGVVWYECINVLRHNVNILFVYVCVVRLRWEPFPEEFSTRV